MEQEVPPNRRRTSLPNELIETYLAYKFPEPGYASIPITQVILPSPSWIALQVFEKHYELFRGLTDTGKLLKIRRHFAVTGSYNEEVVRQAEMNYLSQEINRAGGLQRMFPHIADTYAANAFATFKGLLESTYQKGIVRDGQRFEFTPAEIQFMESQAFIFFNALQTQLITQELKVLSGSAYNHNSVGKLTDHPFSIVLGEFLHDRALRIILQKTDSPVIVEDPNRGLSLALTTFSYSYANRKLALSLLGANLAPSADWGFSSLQDIRDELSTVILRDLKVNQKDLDDVAKKKIPAGPGGRWFFENRSLLEAVKAELRNF